MSPTSVSCKNNSRCLCFAWLECYEKKSRHHDFAENFDITSMDSVPKSYILDEIQSSFPRSVKEKLIYSKTWL
jgi:hypothetical protein